MLRSKGLPVRYVSGYLVPRQSNDEKGTMERVIGGLASHAWVQAFIPETGWIGLDPTVGSFVESTTYPNRIRPGLRRRSSGSWRL